MPGLSVDEDGLSRVLSEWSGVGSLYRSLASIASERSWTPQDVERRANRIVLLELAPLLSQLPTTQRAWSIHLPTLSERRRYWSAHPETRVDWRRTRTRGWPPETFAIRKRHRSSDQFLLSVLGWTLGRLSQAVESAVELAGTRHVADLGLSVTADAAIQACLPLLDQLDSGDLTRPTRDDFAAVRGLGWPWKTVASIGEVLIGIDRGGAAGMASRLLRPDGLPDLLFQLGVLGSILSEADTRGASITSLRPIGQMTSGPVYRIEAASGSKWELWCEAATCWEFYGATDIYKTLAQGLRRADGRPFSARHIRPDILFAREDRGHALVLECKYPFETSDPGYVAGGLYQAYLYASQLRTAFNRTQGFVVGPDELVQQDDARRLRGIPLGVTAVSGLRELVQDLVAV